MTKLDRLKWNVRQIEIKKEVARQEVIKFKGEDGPFHIVHKRNYIEVWDGIAKEEKESIRKANETLNQYIEGFAPWMWPVRWIKKLLKGG